MQQDWCITSDDCSTTMNLNPIHSTTMNLNPIHSTTMIDVPQKTIEAALLFLSAGFEELLKSRSVSELMIIVPMMVHKEFVLHRYCDGPIRTCTTSSRRLMTPTTLEGSGELLCTRLTCRKCYLAIHTYCCDRRSPFSFHHRSGKRAKLEAYRSSFVVSQSELEGFIETLSGA